MRPFRRLSLVLSLLLVALVANLSWLQVINAEGIRRHNDNTRLVLQQYNRARGPIIVGATPIATSSRSSADGLYQRSYSDGPIYAPVTGYYSLLYGATGIERLQNDVLSGNDPRFFVDRVQQLFAGAHQSGGAVTLTLDDSAQRAAFSALGDAHGAVVALDVKTGAVAVMVSTPSFDPQVLAPNDPESVRTAYTELSTDPAEPLTNRALGRTYSSGPVYQVMTMAAALEQGLLKRSSSVNVSSEFTASPEAVRNPTTCSVRGKVTLTKALVAHCATVFAALGSQLGASAQRELAERFGYGASPGVITPNVSSRFPAGRDVATAVRAAIGNVDSTVLQIAIIASAIASGGNIMAPYVVEDVRAPNLAVVEKALPGVRATPLTKRTADALASMMLGVNGRTSCTDCTLGTHPVHLLSAAGKPGWALAFAGRYALATVVEGQGASPSRVAISTLRALLVKE